MCAFASKAPRPDGRAADVGVRANQNAIAQREGKPPRGAEHGVLHDHAVLTDAELSSMLRGQDSTVENSCAAGRIPRCSNCTGERFGERARRTSGIDGA